MYQAVIFSFKVSKFSLFMKVLWDRNLREIFNRVKTISRKIFNRIVLQLECLTYLPKMKLFPRTAFLPEGFENSIIQKVLDRRLYGVVRHFTFWRFSRKWKFFGNFDCDFRKCFAKGVFLTESEVFQFWRRILDIYKQPLLMIRFKPIFDLSRMAWHTLESNTLIFGIPFSITPSLLSVSVGFQQQS